MLEKPDIQDELIITRLQDEFGLLANQLTFLPIGADVNTAVYRVVTEDGTAYFLKLRKGMFEEITVTVPQFLKDNGIQAIIVPVETQEGRLWGSLDSYKMILYPFIQGRNGYEVALSDQQWVDFGKALRAIHTLQVPAALLQLIPRETFSPQWRETVKGFQEQVESSTFEDPIAAKFAGFMQARRGEISRMVGRADQLGLALTLRAPDFVLCHADIHAGNLLITNNVGGARGAFYIVDWDNPVLAPKERDLGMIGGSYTWKLAREEALFYQGYSPTEVDPICLAYYRYERIIQDIAVECEQVLSTSEGGEDREQAYQYFISNFLPNHEIELTIKADKA